MAKIMHGEISNKNLLEAAEKVARSLDEAVAHGVPWYDAISRSLVFAAGAMLCMAMIHQSPAVRLVIERVRELVDDIERDLLSKYTDEQRKQHADLVKVLDELNRANKDDDGLDDPDVKKTVDDLFSRLGREAE